MITHHFLSLSLFIPVCSFFVETKQKNQNKRRLTVKKKTIGAPCYFSCSVFDGAENTVSLLHEATTPSLEYMGKCASIYRFFFFACRWHCGTKRTNGDWKWLYADMLISGSTLCCIIHASMLILTHGSSACLKSNFLLIVCMHILSRTFFPLPLSLLFCCTTQKDYLFNGNTLKDCGASSVLTTTKVIMKTHISELKKRNDSLIEEYLFFFCLFMLAQLHL